MKSDADHYTRDLFGNKSGRPRKLNAKNGAQRTREYRQVRGQQISVTNDAKQTCTWCGVNRDNCCGICTIGQLGRKD
jgi:hypothetical protein